MCAAPVLLLPAPAAPDAFSLSPPCLQFSAGIYGLIPNVSGDPETRSAVERVRRKIAERGGLNGIRTLARIIATMDTTGATASSSCVCLRIGVCVALDVREC